MQIHRELINILVAEEIGRIIDQAARGHGFIRAGEYAYRLAKQYPDCGRTGSELVNDIATAAAHAGVAVEIYQPVAQAA